MSSDSHVIEPPTPTLAKFIRHAELYGTDCVYETAIRYLSKTELVHLDRRLTEINAEVRKKYRDSGTPVPKQFRRTDKRRRMPRADKIKTVIFLTNEGLPDARIADHLGISRRTVRQLRADAREAENRADPERQDAPGEEETAEEG
jgi:DNA invertase Pin-like site-specific DNA recombinase